MQFFNPNWKAINRRISDGDWREINDELKKLKQEVRNRQSTYLKREKRNAQLKELRREMRKPHREKNHQRIEYLESKVGAIGKRLDPERTPHYQLKVLNADEPVYMLLATQGLKVGQQGTKIKDGVTQMLVQFGEKQYRIRYAQLAAHNPAENV